MLWQEIRASGYPGGYSSVRNYLARFRGDAVIAAPRSRAAQAPCGRRRAYPPVEFGQHGRTRQPHQESEFWAVTDWLILNDQLLHRHVFHMPPADQLHRP
jgi:hypothetical protein